jgi:hypothetical protein
VVCLHTFQASDVAWKISNWKNGKLPEIFQKDYFHFGNFPNGNKYSRPRTPGSDPDITTFFVGFIFLK